MSSSETVTLQSQGYKCYRCGKEYKTLRIGFYTTYSTSYKGTIHLHVCKECVEKLYSQYLSMCNDPKAAMRQVCRKLDLYWNETMFNDAEKRSATSSLVKTYITKLNSSNSHIGKSFDDTLLDEGTLWIFNGKGDNSTNGTGAEGIIRPTKNGEEEDDKEPIEPVPQESIAYWGLGYSDEMYRWLDQRKAYYASKWPGIFDGEAGIGNDILIRQLCIQEVSNMQDLASGKSTSQGTSALNNIIGSLNYKPSQQATAEDASPSLAKQPLGVLARKIEERRPIEHDETQKNELIRYILIWYYGHSCKSQGINNAYSRMYEEEMEKFRVAHPEYRDVEDDDDFLSSVFDELAGDDDV